MNLQHLTYFNKIVECGILSKAAQELFITPSALSRAIASLEEGAGVTLFDKKGRNIILNRYYKAIQRGQQRSHLRRKNDADCPGKPQARFYYIQRRNKRRRCNCIRLLPKIQRYTWKSMTRSTSPWAGYGNHTQRYRGLRGRPDPEMQRRKDHIIKGGNLCLN